MGQKATQHSLTSVRDASFGCLVMLYRDKTSSAMRTPVFSAPLPNATAPLLIRSDCLAHNPVGMGHRRSRAAHHPPDARNSRCNLSSEQSAPAPSKMKCHRHSTVLEWHASSGVVSYIDFNCPTLLAQQRHVVDVIETMRYRGAARDRNKGAILSPTMRDSTTFV